jgi:hypothetical protein
MTPNIGPFDRVFRIATGLVLVGLASTGTIGWLGYLGALPLVTGLFGICPAYRLLGIDTCTRARR